MTKQAVILERARATKVGTVRLRPPRPTGGRSPKGCFPTPAPTCAAPADCPRPPKHRSLLSIAADYRRHHRHRAQRELTYYRDIPTDQDAVSRAALAQLPNGKRHPHQHRIPAAALVESRRRLLDILPALRRAKRFDQLHELIDTTIQPILRIGPLAVYDTAVRIGARFGLEPTRVYLHAGTRAGAKALGLDHRRAWIGMDQVPAALRTLTAGEVEDVLCLYKDELRRQVRS